MKVLLTSHGSTGDIFPVIGLGRALAERGHEVSVAVVPYFSAEVRRAGLTWLPVPPDWGQERFAEAMLELSRIQSPLKQLKAIFASLEPYAVDYFQVLDRALPEFDLLVASYLLPQLRGLARRHNKPFAVLTFCHNVVPLIDVPPAPLPRLAFLPHGLRRVWASFGWAMADRVLSHASNRYLGNPCRELGLPLLRGFLTDPADRALVCVSPGLFGGRSDSSSRFCYTGYLRWQSAEDPAMEVRLGEFTGGAKVPILTFGSVTFDDTRRLVRAFLDNLPRDRPVILQSGWSNLECAAAGRRVLHVQRVSHDQLFRHAAVVVHHGGAGTTASALHAGCPQIIIPHIADQQFWANEIRRLGCGTGLSRKNWPHQLPQVISDVMASSAIRAAAAAHATTVNGEDGAGAAVNELVRLVAAR